MDYIVKIGIFTFYMTGSYYIVDYFLLKISLLFVDFPITPLLCHLGIITGLNIFLSFVVTGFLFNKSIEFWR